MKIIWCFLVFTISVPGVLGQKYSENKEISAEPLIVVPGQGRLPPSDATVLYHGKEDLVNWVSDKGEPVKWIADSCLTVVPKTGSIKTVKSFGDVQLHIEWRTPVEITGNGQGRGNSGVILMGFYEIQVLDSYNNVTYFDGQAGSIYKQHVPLKNTSLPPGRWQTYDVVFNAPDWNDDHTLKTPAYITLFHNGILILNHVELKGITTSADTTEYKFHEDKLPLTLQNHTNKVSFRNIWIREL